MLRVSDMLRSLGDHVQFGTSARNVYGDPVTIGGRTVIPIARIACGFGAGSSAADWHNVAGSESGIRGGGAGFGAKPIGALEITEAGTRFIPFVQPAQLIIAALSGLLIGLAIGTRSRARRSDEAR
jgi:uncharacterized spore protein YtfJ